MPDQPKKSKHTPEPLTGLNRRGVLSLTAYHLANRLGCDGSTAEWIKLAMNACAGINPKAVRTAFKALRLIRKEAYGARQWALVVFLVGTALAKAEEGS